MWGPPLRYIALLFVSSIAISWLAGRIGIGDPALSPLCGLIAGLVVTGVAIAVGDL